MERSNQPNLTEVRKNEFGYKIANLPQESSRIYCVISSLIKSCNVNYILTTELVLSECYVRGISAIDRGKEIVNMDAWLLTTSRFIILEATREKTKELSRNTPLEDFDDLLEISGKHERYTEHELELVRRIEEEIRKLKPLDHKIFLLRSGGSSFSDIAMQLVNDGDYCNSSSSLQNTITQRFNRIRKKIQEKIRSKTTE
jgi:DNA-directed RNA polymerase specialized sigma24 family protein